MRFNYLRRISSLLVVRYNFLLCLHKRRFNSKILFQNQMFNHLTTTFTILLLLLNYKLILKYIISIINDRVPNFMVVSRSSKSIQFLLAGALLADIS